MDPTVEWVMELLNWIFMFIFSAEAAIKLIAMKCDYFANGWNMFDFAVVIGSVVAILL